MARVIICPFCPEGEQQLALPANWSGHYAMTWFYTQHLGEHVDEMLACRPCALVMRAEDPTHRPCFDPDCTCPCSDTPQERTATDADG